MAKKSKGRKAWDAVTIVDAILGLGGLAWPTLKEVEVSMKHDDRCYQDRHRGARLHGPARVGSLETPSTPSRVAGSRGGKVPEGELDMRVKHVVARVMRTRFSHRCWQCFAVSGTDRTATLERKDLYHEDTLSRVAGRLGGPRRIRTEPGFDRFGFLTGRRENDLGNEPTTP